jgi:hypothetical protein
MRGRITCDVNDLAGIAGNIAAAAYRKMAKWRRNRRLCPLFKQIELPIAFFEPTGRPNGRPMTGSVGTGSREENASKQKGL